LLGRIHTQLVWERGCFDAWSWGKFDRMVAGPDAVVEIPEGFDVVKSFKFAESCLRESVRIVTECASHDRSMIRTALMDLARLYGMGAMGPAPKADDADDPPADSAAVLVRNAALSAAYLNEAVSCTKMQEVLFHDTVSLMDKQVIDGSDMPESITAGLQDAEFFFGDSRVLRPEDGRSKEVGALSVLMYYLTLCKERPLSGMTHFSRLERWATKLHRQLKKMFAKYVDSCCYTGFDVEGDVPALESGTLRIQWAEFPFVENEDDSPLNADGSRPSSGGSRVVQTARDDTIIPKDLPTTMVYCLARPPPADDGQQDEKPILGMLQGSLEQVEEILRKLQEVNYLIEVHKREKEGEPLNEIIQAQIKDALKDVWSFFQADSPGERMPNSTEIGLQLPEEADVAVWVPHLVKLFKRQLGINLVDEPLWQWLCMCVSQREADLQVMRQ